SRVDIWGELDRASDPHCPACERAEQHLCPRRSHANLIRRECNMARPSETKACAPQDGRQRASGVTLNAHRLEAAVERRWCWRAPRNHDDQFNLKSLAGNPKTGNGVVEAWAPVGCQHNAEVVGRRHGPSGRWSGYPASTTPASGGSVA